MNLDLVITVVLMTISLAMGVQSIGLGLGTLIDPGAGFMPMLTASCVFVLSLTHLVVQMIKKKKWTGSTSMGSHWFEAGCLIALSFVYVLFLWDKLGFLISTFLWLLVIFRMGGIRSWKRIIITTFITVTVSFVLFEKVAKTLLPKGPFGF